MKDQDAVAATLKSMNTPALVEMFEESNTRPMNEALGMVRGWLLDGLEARNPTAFAAWIDSTEDSPRRFYAQEGTP